jgi:hypothetical protein
VGIATASANLFVGIAGLLVVLLLEEVPLGGPATVKGA